MILKDLEKISEYFDGESKEPHLIEELINSDESSARFYGNIQLISKTLNPNKEIKHLEADLDSFWTKVESQLRKDDEVLNELMEKAYGQLPPKLNDIDIWDSLEKRIERESSFKSTEIKEVLLIQQSDEKPGPQSGDFQGWEILAIKDAFQLPKNLNNFDLWENISAKLDGHFHPEIFTENARAEMSDKEKFFLGLSEYVDGETSAQKTVMIMEHLPECSSCRKYYLSFIKLSKALQYSFREQSEENNGNFWKEVEGKLFGEEEKVDWRKIQGL